MYCTAFIIMGILTRVLGCYWDINVQQCFNISIMLFIHKSENALQKEMSFISALQMGKLRQGTGTLLEEYQLFF